MIKVSIIVPIYNAGHRLRECLETLINQTLREIEIICVLDCPTDGSEKIAEEYAARDNRINLIYNETNLHVAESRNRGMAAAKGEYIGFSDHDDIRALNMYEELYYNAIKYSSNVVISNSIIRSNNEDIVCKYKNYTHEGLIKSLIIGNSDKNENFLSSVVWSNIYRNSFIKDNKISFLDRVNKYLEEDVLFNLTVYLNTDKISFVNKAFYVWQKHPDSLSEKWETNEADKRLNQYTKMYELLSSVNLFKKYRLAYLTSLEYTINRYYPFFLKMKKDRLQELKKDLKNINYPAFAKYKDLKMISKKRIKLYTFYWKLFLIK